MLLNAGLGIVIALVAILLLVIVVVVPQRSFYEGKILLSLRI